MGAPSGHLGGNVHPWVTKPSMRAQKRGGSWRRPGVSSCLRKKAAQHLHLQKPEAPTPPPSGDASLRLPMLCPVHGKHQKSPSLRRDPATELTTTSPPSPGNLSTQVLLLQVLFHGFVTERALSQNGVHIMGGPKRLRDRKSRVLCVVLAPDTHTHTYAPVVFTQRRNETPVFSTRGSCILQTSSWAQVPRQGTLLHVHVSKTCCRPEEAVLDATCRGARPASRSFTDASKRRRHIRC